MRVSVQGAGAQTYTERNKTVSGFRVIFQATDVANITGAILRATNLTVQLYRQGMAPLIMGSNVFALGLAQSMGNFEGAAIGTADTGRISFLITLGPGLVINLKDGDELAVTLTVGSAAAGQNVTVSTEYGVGIEMYTPVISVYPVQKTNQNMNLPAGDNVSMISIVNTSTDHVVTSANIQSDFWSGDYSQNDFFALMASQWSVTPRQYSFCVYNDQPTDNVTGSLVVNTGATGDCYVVVNGGIITNTIKERAAKLAGKIAAKQEAKYSPSPIN